MKSLQLFRIFLPAIVAITILLANPPPLQAANITCVQTAKQIPWMLNNKEEIKEHFPSGRVPTPTTCLSIWISGPIVEGDSDRFFQLLQRNHPFVQSVSLSSPGGNAIEAMTIGKLVRKYLLITVAPMLAPVGNVLIASSSARSLCKTKDCYCASSCFLIWAAGAYRGGDVLGLHRPSIHSKGFDRLPPDEAARTYRTVLSDVRTYLDQMEIPRQFIELMTDTASNEIVWISDDDAKLMSNPPSISEAILSSCGGLTRQEESNFPDPPVLKKFEAINRCTFIKRAAYRDSYDLVEKP